MQKVLITGGAGFIGSHAADALLAAGYQVRILDSLAEQVHGPDRSRPIYLDGSAELVVGDIADRDAVAAALNGVDAVLHLAASVGVGQSMYDIADYVRVNEGGTAVLLEALSRHPVQRLVVASSMSIYGEGLYRDNSGSAVEPCDRRLHDLRRGKWDLRGENGAALLPSPTPETKRPNLSSIYAINKYAQERMCLVIGRAYGIPTVALRFFNVFGSRQALSNPYTGVLAIFAARILNGRPPLVFEDGLQRRDFVHVSDVARACRLALESACDGEVFNIGSGESRTILSVAEDFAKVMNRTDLRPQITAKYRAGDIRHCFADVSHAEHLLGFRAMTNFEQGLERLTEEIAGQIADDRAEQATRELVRRGLVA